MKTKCYMWLNFTDQCFESEVGDDLFHCAEISLSCQNTTLCHNLQVFPEKNNTINTKKVHDTFQQKLMGNPQFPVLKHLGIKVSA